MSQKCKFCFRLYLQEIYAQFEETLLNQESKQTIMDLDLQITWKHPVSWYHASKQFLNKIPMIP